MAVIYLKFEMHVTFLKNYSVSDGIIFQYVWYQLNID